LGSWQFFVQLPIKPSVGTPELNTLLVGSRFACLLVSQSLVTEGWQLAHLFSPAVDVDAESTLAVAGPMLPESDLPHPPSRAVETSTARRTRTILLLIIYFMVHTSPYDYKLLNPERGMQAKRLAFRIQEPIC
jgi:hypothetical protein